MTFEERLKTTNLPEMAILLLPNTLSERIKREVADRLDMEDIICSVIRTIENGSIETVETLTTRELMQRNNHKE